MRKGGETRIQSGRGRASDALRPAHTVKMSDVRHDNEGYRRFREAMQSGKLQAGMVVTQNELCDLLGLSLSPLRDTLVLLEEFGLVEIKPRTGIRIVYPEIAFIRENFQFRIMIEVHALRAFGEAVTDEWLANMRARHEECRTELEANGSFDAVNARIATLDRQFHRDIVDALDNRAILETHHRLQENPEHGAPGAPALDLSGAADRHARGAPARHRPPRAARRPRRRLGARGAFPRLDAPHAVNLD